MTRWQDDEGDVYGDDDATEDSVEVSAVSSVATSLGYQLGTVAVRGRQYAALVWPDRLDELPEPLETEPDTRPGPSIEVSASMRPIPGEAALEVWHGTHRHPSLRVRVVLVRETPETAQPAYWRARLPGVVISAYRADRWQPDGTGVRRIWELREDEEGPSPDASRPDEVQPIRDVVTIRIGRRLAVRAVRSSVPLPGHDDVIVYDVPPATLAELIRHIAAGTHLT